MTNEAWDWAEAQAAKKGWSIRELFESLVARAGGPGHVPAGRGVLRSVPKDADRHFRPVPKKRGKS